MIKSVLAFSIAYRWIVVTVSVGVALLGVYALLHLPIDAVPDITNNQVQINTTAPALSPVEIEKQVTFPIETALAGTPGLENTRSLSRNGFSQVTAVFSERTDIYFARQQVNERLLELRSSLPPGAEPRMGPISTGLGEIYMWTVSYGDAPARDGQSGRQSNGTFITPEGLILATEVERSAYLRTVQDWIVRPQIKGIPGVAGVDSIGGYRKQYQVQPDPAKLIGLRLSFADVAKAIEANNVSRGARYIERNGEGLVVRSGGRLENLDELGDVVYLDLPWDDAGSRDFKAGEHFGDIESVKATSELFIPVSGALVAVNSALQTTPELVNSEPYGGGWMLRVRLSDPAELDKLMDAAAYTEFLKTAGH